jgi:hypothetical protein
MTKEEAVFRSNLKYAAKYVLVGLSLLTFTALLVWDPYFWGFLIVTLAGLKLYYKIWG